MQAQTKSLLALDIGASRIGVASANNEVRIAQPLKTLDNPASFFADIQRLVVEYNAVVLVAGLPRGLDGQRTTQTEAVETFVEELKKQLDVPVAWQDEAVTSKKAEAELHERGKDYAKGDIDALAATYILEDYIKEHQA